MKSEFLKLAGVKTEKAFYKKYPTEAAFFKAHPEAKKLIPKAQVGRATPMTGLSQNNPLMQYLNNANLATNPPGIVEGMGEGQPGIDNNYYSVFDQEITPIQMPSNLPGVILPSNNMSFPQIQNTVPQITPQAAQDKSKTPDLGKLVGAGIGGFQAIKQQKKELAKAKQMAGVTDLFRQASAIREEAPERRYVRPEDAIINPNQVFPTYGVGTNVLAKNGAEIQNTFAPNTLYDDLGYEPLYDSERYKQFQFGGQLSGMFKGDGMFGKESLTDFTKQGGLDKISGMVYPDMNESGTAQIGGGLGEAAGTMIGGPIGGAIGKAAGQVIGRAVDPYQGKIKKEKQRTQQNISATMINQGAAGLQNQYKSYMEDGGIIPNPQVISMFGDYTPEEIYDIANEGMDTLRAGGHVQSYKNPSERALQTYAMGGDIQTHWGGYAEEISENPYMPNNGETVMFRGQSHDDSDGKGNTGIGITFGDNPVEVERGEPATKIGDDLVVYGNLKIPNEYVELFDDKNAKGKKFKNYVADLSKQENKNNKFIEKNTLELDELDVTNPFDKLKLNSLQANISGTNAKLKDIADKKLKAASLQNAINDTAEEFGIDADALAKGKIKFVEEELTPIGKNGINVAKAGGTYNIEDYNKLIQSIASQKNVDPKVIQKLVGTESSYSTKAKSDKGASGIMQLTPAVAKKYGVEKILNSNKPEDVKRVIAAGVDFYKTLLKQNNNDYILASAAYNGGQGAVNFVKEKLNKNNITGQDWVNYMSERRRLNPSKDKSAWQNETFNYVNKIHLNDNVSTVTPETTKPVVGQTQVSQQPVTETVEKVVAEKPKEYAIKPSKKGNIGYNKDTDVEEWKGENYKKVWQPAVANMINDPELRDRAISFLENDNGPYAKEVKEKLAKGKTPEEKGQIIINLTKDSKFGPFHDAVKRAKDYVNTPTETPSDIPTQDIPEVTITKKKKTPPEPVTYKSNKLVNILNQALPYLRPSDAEALDPNQILGEMYALSSNQLEPVQAQTYQPQLITPYDISLQDILNENQADYRAQQRMVGYNPAAQAMLNAQKYAANQKVLGEQFRQNQAQRMGVYNQNINTLNDAKLKNIGIFDNQYERQAQAKAITKATTQAALNSISSKYLQNDAANRKLQVYENLYNYRFDPMGRAINMNPLQQFNPSGNPSSQLAQLGLVPIYDNAGNVTGYGPGGSKSSKNKTTTPSMATPPFVAEDTESDKSRNGKKVKSKNLNSVIVKAMKNL